MCVLCRFRLQYGSVWTNWRGRSDNGVHTHVTFDPDEYVTGMDSITGSVRDDHYTSVYYLTILHTLTIYTNKRTLGPYGYSPAGDTQRSRGKYLLYVHGMSGWQIGVIEPTFLIC